MSDDAKKILAALQSGALPQLKASETKGKKGMVNVRYNTDSCGSDFSRIFESAVSYSAGIPSCGEKERQNQEEDNNQTVVGPNNKEKRG